MQGLPYYQTSIREALDELGLLVQRYGGEDSPLGKEKAERLKATLETARQHCLERLDTNLPRIMLYGVYNAGKSTLLNALLGREEASVADKPETYKLTAYSWNGYELLDFIKPMGVPVIFITAKGTMADKVRGLQLGAEDYGYDYYRLRHNLEQVSDVIFAAADAADAFALARENGIQWLYVCRALREEGFAGAEPAFENEAARIYRVA